VFVQVFIETAFLIQLGIFDPLYLQWSSSEWSRQSGTPSHTCS